MKPCRSPSDCRTAPLCGSGKFAGRLLDILEDNQESYITSKQLFDKLARALVGAEGLNPEWGTIADAGDEGSGEFTFILRAKPLASGE